MKIIMQRVNYCKLTSEEYQSNINFGLLVFVGVNKEDTDYDINYLAKKIVVMRQFEDDLGKSNLSLIDVQGEVMLVSNFTLQAQTKKGTRPDFINAGNADFAQKMYLKLAEKIKEYGVKVELGKFGHHMTIDCSLNGPFTLILESQGRDHE